MRALKATRHTPRGGAHTPQLVLFGQEGKLGLVELHLLGLLERVDHHKDVVHGNTQAHKHHEKVHSPEI